MQKRKERIEQTRAVRALRERIETWRRERPHRSRMPATLWTAAALAAGKYGVHPVARALRLDYYSLKRRVSSNEEPQSRAGFVELTPVTTSSPLPCEIEMERADGARMSIRMGSSGDVVELGRLFWGASA